MKLKGTVEFLIYGDWNAIFDLVSHWIVKYNRDK